MEINLQRTALLTIYVQEHFMQMFATERMVESMAEVQEAARQAGMLFVHPRGPSHDEGFPAVGPLGKSSRAQCQEVWLQVWRHAGRHSGLGDHSKASASGGGDRHAGVSFGALCGNVAGRRVAQPGYPHPGLYGIDRQRRGREEHRDRCDQPRLRRWWYSRTVCRIPTAISRGSTGS